MLEPRVMGVLSLLTLASWSILVLVLLLSLIKLYLFTASAISTIHNLEAIIVQLPLTHVFLSWTVALLPVPV